MNVKNREHEYNGFTRTEKRTEEIPLYEDFLILSKLAETAAKAAYTYENCSDNKKKEAELVFKDAIHKVSEQFGIIRDYEPIQIHIKTKGVVKQ